MQPYGQDRVRSAGGRLLLHAPFSKGWTPRVPKQGTHSEHPGTAVLWDEHYWEVIAAEPGADGGVLYVLSPWRGEQVIRVVSRYDESAEQQRIAGTKQRLLQTKQNLSVRLSSCFLGLLPAVVQNRIANQTGVSPSAMTVVSCIIPIAVFAIYALVTAGALVEEKPSPLPPWFTFIAWYLLVEAALRFYIAMSQSRAVGSAAGFFVYFIYWLTVLKGDPQSSPFAHERGDGSFVLAPSDEQAMQDGLETWGPLLSLLPASEQSALEKRFGFDHRRHAYGLTWTILFFSSIGIISSALKLAGEGFRISLGLSLACAGFLAVEQIRRLINLQHGPAGSVLAALVRPFLRRFFPAAKA